MKFVSGIRLGAILLIGALFAGGEVVDERVLRAEMTNNGTIKSPLYSTYRFIIRYFAPLCIFLIFANELGLFGFLK